MGFGSISGHIDKVRVLCPPGSELERFVKKWKIKNTRKEPVWQHYEIDGENLWKNNEFTDDMQKNFANLIGEVNVPARPFKTNGFVSHRQYSKLCGILRCELEALSPLHIKESGEPSFQESELIGYDFFSISPPKSGQKPDIGNREYALSEASPLRDISCWVPGS